MRHLRPFAVGLSALLLAALGAPATARAPGDARVTPDAGGAYSRLDGSSDAVHAFCRTSRRQQAEPAVAVSPRDPRVVVAGAADQCSGAQRQFPISQAQGWLGLYRSTDGGRTWRAGLLPGYPGDSEASTQCGQADATMAFDRQGRLFYGALCPDFVADEMVRDFHIQVSTLDRDGSRYLRTVRVDADIDGDPDVVAAPDKPNLTVDTTRGRHAGNVYVAYTTCPRVVLEQGAKSIAPCIGDEGDVHVTRSTDAGRTFRRPVAVPDDVPGKPNFVDLAVGPDGTVHVTATTMDSNSSDSDVLLSRSVDGGATFSPFTRVARVKPFNTAQFAGTGNGAGAADETQTHNAPCGDGAFACASGFVFSPVRTLSAVAADASGVHLAWSAQLPSGQAKVFVRSSPDGVRWPRPAVVVDPVRRGHQWYPDVAAADGVVHVVFYDSRADRAYAPDRPPGNTADGRSSGPSVDTYAAQSRDGGRTWRPRRLSTVTQQPGLQAHLGARVPWLGDYLYVSAVRGRAYAVWADARDVVPGRDTRGGRQDGFDVSAPCAWLPATEAGPTGYPFARPSTGDGCLSQGGLDVNVYGATLR